MSLSGFSNGLGSLAVENEAVKGKPMKDRIAKLQKQVFSFDDPELRKGAFNKLQGILRSNEANEAASHIIQMPLLEEILRLVSEPDVSSLEELSIATELVSNIASTSTENTKQMVSEGAIDYLVNLLRQMITLDKNVGVMRTRTIESAIWAIGNIAGDGVQHRNLVIASKAHLVIQELLALPTLPMSIIRISIWALSNLPRGGRFPSELLSLVPYAVRIMSIKDTESSVDALWLLSYLSDGDDENQRTVAGCTGVITGLMEYLSFGTDVQFLIPALRAAGNLLTGADYITSTVLEHDIIRVLKPLLKHHRTGIRKEAAWAFSNILGGTRDHISLCMEQDILTALLEIANSRQPHDVIKEASWAITNAVLGSSAEDFAAIVSLPGFISCYAACLTHQEAGLYQLAASAMDRVMIFGEQLGALESTDFADVDGLEIRNPYFNLIIADIDEHIDREADFEGVRDVMGILPSLLEHAGFYRSGFEDE